MNFFVVVPTLNAAEGWSRLTPLLLESIAADRVLILDSSSTDETVNLADAAGFRVHTIARSEFNHGGTRQLAAELLPDAEILVFLTQDIELAQFDAIRWLLKAFTDPDVAAAFGRQLPRRGATPIEAHARFYNYPAQSGVRTLSSREQLGFKAIFISNSFAAYRREALMAVGGFPRDVIFGEDTVTAARLLLSGWKLAYVAEAQVYHSHSYTWMQEFRRYFDIGVLHRRQSWMLSEFGGAGGEGGRFVRSELRFLWPRHWWLLPSALIHTAAKLLGYRLGRVENLFGAGLKRRLSMNRLFWN
ncbi:glycosyltransferase family 2 protein [Tunturibacter empetritectus]|uniref:Rhamnosyltransferase n=1 Tax=Tunturiibacter lichenicola TaxID=2051959 RepID=A0A7W8J451_9BACT|nr:glycosyltransferase family 2 protein [Edaphobacter lichenicola]MBB5342217.1 rhamnosyltransferase [Edaphobacter lichenicola]